MTPLPDLIGDWRTYALVLAVFGFAPGAVLRLIVRAYPKDHPRRRELVAELYSVRYVERPLFVAQQLETAVFEGLPARWRSAEQVSRFVRQLDEWRRNYPSVPIEVIHEHLDDGEYVIHCDGRYVVTNCRLIYLAATSGKPIASIPWSDITGLGYRQTPLGRVFGRALIFVETVDDVPELRTFSRINDPAMFHQGITAMLTARLTATAPEPDSHA